MEGLHHIPRLGQVSLLRFMFDCCDRLNGLNIGSPSHASTQTYHHVWLAMRLKGALLVQGHLHRGRQHGRMGHRATGKGCPDHGRHMLQVRHKTVNSQVIPSCQQKSPLPFKSDLS